MALPLLLLSGAKALAIAKVISSIGLKAAVKKYGSQAANMVNKNIMKIKKNNPDVFGPTSKKLTSPKGGPDKSAFMDEKGRFISKAEAAKLKKTASVSRAALAAGPGSVAMAAPIILSGNPNEDSKKLKGYLPKPVTDSLRSYKSTIIADRQPELDAISPGPDPKPKTQSKTPPKPKPRPAAKTPPKPKPRPAAKKPAAKNSVTTTGGRPVTTTGGRPLTVEKSTAKKPAAAKKSTAAAKKKAPGKFSEEAGKAFFKKLGIDAKYDDDDMPKRSSPERAKGGMVAKKKPVVAKKYGGMAVKKKAGGTVKKMCGGMAHRSKKGKK